MTDRTVTVAVAKVMWSYYTAADVRDCTVTRTDGQWQMVGSIVSSDALRLSRQPLTLVVTHQHGCLKWPVLEQPQIVDGVLHARLGPLEVPDGYHRQAEDRQAVSQ